MHEKTISLLIIAAVLLLVVSEALPERQAKPLRTTMLSVRNHMPSRKAYATYDAKGNMISVVSLFDLAASSDCKKETTYSGVISKVEFNNKREIESFSITVQRKSRKSWLLRYDFPPDPYEGELEQVDREKLPTLIRQGNRVRVESCACGLKAYALFSHSIYKL